MSDSDLKKLQNAQGKLGLAIALGISLRQLTRAIYGIPVDQRYRVFTIPKSLGGLRTIHVPHRELKYVQKALSNVLQRCLTEIEQKHEEKKPVSHGFQPGRSIFSNAWIHRRKNYVMNFDLDDFFPSIHFGRVNKFFEKNNDFLLHPKVCNLIANLACHRNDDGSTFLPQGSPSSPVISNLIARPLDYKLRTLARQNDCRYSRYADDLTFSTNCDEFPEDIAFINSTNPDDWVAGPSIISDIQRSGFSLNPAKTHMSIAGTRQVVTGLVVNKQVSVNRTTYKWVRAASERMFKQGFAFRHIPSTANVHTTARLVTLSHLMGQANHICFARRKSDIPLAQARKMRGPELLYKRLTYYDRFFAHDRPVIITEGVTDNVYLRIALSKLGKKFKNLQQNADKTLPIRLLNTTDHITRYTGLNGGSDQQKVFLQFYDEDMKIVGDRWSDKCVILLCDNDSGANAIMQTIRKKSAIVGDIRTLKFSYYIRNLYVVLTPINKEDETSTIEDFLDPKAVKTVLNGKTFHQDGKNFNELKHYSKKVLAEKVIKENADKFDFTNFSEILSRIDLVIEDYNTRLAKSRTPI